MIDRKILFDHPVKSDIRTYDNIQTNATGQGDDYTTGSLLDYNYFNNYYKMIAIEWIKQEALDGYPKALQQINFTGNLDQAEEANNVFHYWRSKRNHFIFFSKNCEGIVNVFHPFVLF